MHRQTVAVAVALAAVTVTFACGLCSWTLVATKRRRAKLPPGDFGWPIVGEMLRLLASPIAFWDSRGRAAASAGTGAYSTSILMSDTVVVTSPELATFALRTEALGKADMINHPVLKAVFGSRNIFALKGDDHTRLRKVLQKAFTPEATRAYLPALDRCVVNFLERLSSTNEEVVSDAAFKTLALDMFLVTAVGRTLERPFLDRIARLFAEMAASVTGVSPFPLPGTAYHRALRARRELDSILVGILTEFQNDANNPTHKRANKTTTQQQHASMVGMMLDTRDECGQPLSTEEILDSLCATMFAGHDTTASTLSALVKRLTENPSILATLRIEVRELFPDGLAAPLDFDKLRGAKWLNAVMNESWRFSPPVNFAPRVTNQDVELPDTPYVLPKGTLLFTSIWALAHDDAFWGPNAYAFDPEAHFLRVASPSGSSLSPHFSVFGGSSRTCVGEQLSRLETLIFLARVAQGFALHAAPLPPTEFPVVFETSRLRVVALRG